MTARTPTGLAGDTKQRLIQQALARRSQAAAQGATLEQAQQAALKVPEAFYRFDQHPGYQQLRVMQQGAARLGLSNPFFRMHEGTAGASTQIGEREYLNFASYNYLGYSGHPQVAEAAKAAIDRYGTSVSASRPVSGDRPLHRELERELASVYDVEDAVVMVSGHATNVTTIGYLFGPRDLVVHDELIHNSVLQGIQLSGARRLSFPHNDWQALDRLLGEQRQHFERVLVVVEGIYSMDGDYPELPRFVELKRKHKVFLMVDEAHSLGVMGATGKGIREHFDLAGEDVDIGTQASKRVASPAKRTSSRPSCISPGRQRAKLKRGRSRNHGRKKSMLHNSGALAIGCACSQAWLRLSSSAMPKASCRAMACMRGGLPRTNSVKIRLSHGVSITPRQAG